MICILLLLGCTYLGYLKYVRIVNHFNLARWHLGNAQTLIQNPPTVVLSPRHLEALRGEFAQAEEDFKGLKVELRPFLYLARFGRWLPGVGSDIQAAPHLIDLAIGSSSAGRLTCEGLYSLSALATRQPLALEDSGEEILDALVQGGPKFAAAMEELDKAVKGRRAINEGDLSSEAVAYIELLDGYLPSLRWGIRALTAAPDLVESLLGLSVPRRLMLVIQNSHELRATGGFISGIGLVNVDKGKVTKLDFYGSAAFDDPSQRYSPPPESLFNCMWAGLWLLRDANWSPDFPTSARIIEGLYELSQGASVDGIIAVDETAVKFVLEATGPVYLDAYGERVNAENVWEKIKQYHDEPFGGKPRLLSEEVAENWAIPASKLFVGELLEGVLARLQEEVTTSDVVRFLGALQRGLDQRHILLYIHDTETEALLQEYNWGGSLRPTEGDYLLVIDSNVGYNKINPNIEESIDYQVELKPDGGAQGTVIITYHNKSTEGGADCIQGVKPGQTYGQMMEGCYWDYLRVYVPRDSRLTEATRIPFPEGSLLSWVAKRTGPEGPTVGPSEAGKDVFGQFFVVAPGEKRRVGFRYDLPEVVFSESEKRYALLIQKQPGTIAVPVKVTILVPLGMEIVSAKPRPTLVSGNRVKYETTLLTDRQFELILSGEAKPIVEEAPLEEGISFPWLEPIPAVAPTPSLIPTLKPTESRKPPATWIRIPKIGVDAGVVEMGWKVVIEEGVRKAKWEIPGFAVGHRIDSANPGEGNKIVMTAHNNIGGKTFKLLFELEAGDEIFLRTADDRQYRYVVAEAMILLEKAASPEEIAAHARYMDPTPEETLTLISCWPEWSNTHRVIVVAKP